MKPEPCSTSPLAESQAPDETGDTGLAPSMVCAAPGLLVIDQIRNIVPEAKSITTWQKAVCSLMTNGSVMVKLRGINKISSCKPHLIIIDDIYK